MPNTSAFSTAKRNLERARYFLDIHEGTQEGPGTPNNKRRELPRGAVVFAVGALDAYLSEVGAEVMVTQFERGLAGVDTRKIMKSVQQQLPTLALEVSIAGPEVDRSALVRTAIADYFHDQVSNHGSKAVAGTVERMGGAPTTLWEDLAADGEVDAARRLDEWTAKRHAIVHRGERPVINRDPARKCVRLITAICTAVDAVALTAKTG